MAKPTHSVMPHSLAKALIEAGVQHFDAGGMAVPVAAPMGGQGPATTASGDAGFFGNLFGQSDYEANLAPMQESNYSGVINSSAGNVGAGYQNSQQIQAQQQLLANALLAQSRGQGPNPAQAALNQSTGQNIANQAALMASQRGSGGNVGLMARQAAQQGGNIQQQAVGQGATMQAQQQLAAQGALAQQQAAMQQGNIAEQGVNAGMFGAAAGAQNTQNNANLANYGMVQGINSGVATGNAGHATKAAGGLLGGVGSLLGLAKGGTVPDHIQKMSDIYHPGLTPTNMQSGGYVPGQAQVAGNSPKNDTVLAALSPGEEVLPRSVTQSPDAPAKAAEFVRHLQQKKSSKGYGEIADSKKSLKERIENLEKMFKGGVAA